MRNIVLFLQYSPLTQDSKVIAYTETEVYIRQKSQKDELYYIQTHLVTKIKTEIPDDKFKNHSLPVRIVRRKGNTFTLQATSLNGQPKNEFEGRLIEIETKAELIPDLEKILDKLGRRAVTIKSIPNRDLSQEKKDEIVKLKNVEICKLLKILEIGSLVFETEKLERLLRNLIKVKEIFEKKPAVAVPKKLANLIGEYEQQLKEVNHFNGHE